MHWTMCHLQELHNMLCIKLHKVQIVNRRKEWQKGSFDGLIQKLWSGLSDVVLYELTHLRSQKNQLCSVYVSTNNNYCTN